LSRAINLIIGRAAFETAKRMLLKDCLEYRHGAQIVERNDRTAANHAAAEAKFSFELKVF
jgi:hypothetical protein